MKKVIDTGVGKITIAKKEGDISEEELNLQPDEKKKAFEEAYKKQNPAKYEIKKAAGAFN